MTTFLLLSLLFARAVAGEAPCSTTTTRSFDESVSVEGHGYELMGACGIRPVYRATHAASARDLVRNEKIPIATLIGGPNGENRYLAYRFPGTTADARSAIDEVINDYLGGVAIEDAQEHSNIFVDFAVRPDDSALWRMLNALSTRGSELIRQRLYDEAAEHIFWELNRHGITEADGTPVTEQSIGRPITVQGFARNSGRGAIVFRTATLARCDSTDQWPKAILGRFVTTTGTLAWLPVQHEAQQVPEFDFHDNAVLQLIDCDVQVGVRTEDIAEEKWRALRAAGVDEALGERVSVDGVLVWDHHRSILLTGATEIILDSCQGSGPGRANGTLGYRAPLMLKGVEPRIRLVKVATGVPDGFILEDCNWTEQPARKRRR